MQLSRKCFQSIGLLSLSLLLLACSASQRVVKTYEGQTLPEDQLARLVVSEDIKIVEIDGVKQKTYLLDNLSLTYSMLPGEHTIVYRYASIWARSRARVDKDEAKVDLVKSELRQVRMVFHPSKSYFFNFQKPSDQREAVQFAQKFSAVVVDESGLTVASDTPVTSNAIASSRSRVSIPASSSVDAVAGDRAVKPVLQPFTAAPEGATLASGSPAKRLAPENAGESPSAQTIAPVNAGLSRLDAIKVLWSRASAEEKKEFLRWAFQ